MAISLLREYQYVVRNALRLSFSGLTSWRGTIILSFQNMFAFYILQHGHLLDGYLVEFLETFALRHAFMYKDGIQILHITQANQLVNRCVVADVAFVLRMGVTPFFGSQDKTVSPGGIFNCIEFDAFKVSFP